MSLKQVHEQNIDTFKSFCSEEIKAQGANFELQRREFEAILANKDQELAQSKEVRDADAFRLREELEGRMTTKDKEVKKYLTTKDEDVKKYYQRLYNDEIAAKLDEYEQRAQHLKDEAEKFKSDSKETMKLGISTAQEAAGASIGWMQDRIASLEKEKNDGISAANQAAEASKKQMRVEIANLKKEKMELQHENANFKNAKRRVRAPENRRNDIQAECNRLEKANKLLREDAAGERQLKDQALDYIEVIKLQKKEELGEKDRQIELQKDQIVELGNSLVKQKKSSKDLSLQINMKDEDRKCGADVAAQMFAEADLATDKVKTNGRKQLPGEKRKSAKMDASRSRAGAKSKGVQKSKRATRRAITQDDTEYDADSDEMALDEDINSLAKSNTGGGTEKERQRAPQKSPYDEEKGLETMFGFTPPQSSGDEGHSMNGIESSSLPHITGDNGFPIEAVQQKTPPESSGEDGNEMSADEKAAPFSSPTGEANKPVAVDGSPALEGSNGEAHEMNAIEKNAPSTGTSEESDKMNTDEKTASSPSSNSNEEDGNNAANPEQTQPTSAFGAAPNETFAFEESEDELPGFQPLRQVRAPKARARR